jgi:3',5'-cyclic AMP phosphodiesterase CpdA
MRLAHFTDLHLPIPESPRLKDLLSKRALGYLSWSRNRRFRHQREALDRLTADYRGAGANFAAITGDIANISLPIEFSAAIQWLKSNFQEQSSGFCPGNHDAYVTLDWEIGLGRLSPFMSGVRSDGKDRPPVGPDDFPFVRRIGDVAVIFANSSPPTLPGLASGRLGAGQIERIRQTLSALGGSGLCRVLALHHPVTDGATPARKALDDRAALRTALYDAGVELVLHGHTHYPVWATIDTRAGPRPVVGGGSASHPSAHGRYSPARYNLFDIDRTSSNGWRIHVETRELDPATGEVKTAERRDLLQT